MIRTMRYRAYQACTFAAVAGMAVKALGAGHKF